jgi:hypothetical protein
MINFVYDKAVITQRVLAVITPEYTQDELSSATYTWWRNKRESGGLGLTDLGLQCFVQANFEKYTFDLNSYNQGMGLGEWIMQLSLDRKMPCPYYAILNKRSAGSKLMVFDGRVASMIMLYGGVQEYLQAQSARPNASPLPLNF